MVRKRDTIRIAFYMRVSSFEQDVENSIGGQRSNLRAVAAAMDGEIYKEYIDEGITGRRDSRPSFQQMMRDAQQKPRPFDVLLIWDQSRLSRKSTTALGAIEKLESLGIEVREVRDETPSDPKTRKLVRTIKGGINEYQLDVMSEDIIRGQRHTTSRGFWVAPNEPYGYQREYVFEGPKRRSLLKLHPEAAQHVRLIFDLLLNEMSPARVTRWLNENGHRKWDGTNWKASHIRKIMNSAVYMGTFVRGLRSKNKSQPVTFCRDACEPIVTKEEFDQVQELKIQRTFESRHPRVSASPYPLSGLLECEEHHSNMNMEGARNRKGGKYTCSALRNEQQTDCPTPRIPAADIHARVAAAVTERILTDDTLTAIAEGIRRNPGDETLEKRKELNAVRQRLASANQSKARLNQKVMLGQMDDTDITDEVAGIRDNIAQLEGQVEELTNNLANQNAFLTDLDRIKAYARDLNTYLREGTEDTVKMIFHLVIEKIIVRPGSATIRYTIPMPPPDGAGEWTLSEELDLEDGPALRIGPLAKAGIQEVVVVGMFWIPAQAGMTIRGERPPTRTLKRPW